MVEPLGVRHPGLAETALGVTAQGQDVAHSPAAPRPMLRSSATECPTHVRCAIGVSEVWSSTRWVRRTVRSQVPPPAP